MRIMRIMRIMRDYEDYEDYESLAKYLTRHVSRVTCYVSRVTCYVSRVTSHESRSSRHFRSFEQGLHEDAFVEHLELVHFFADADVFDGDFELVGDADGHAAFGSAV